MKSEIEGENSEQHATDEEKVGEEPPEEYDEDAGMDSIANHQREIFLIDLETSGFKGMVVGHESNQIVQICGVHLRSGDVFESICKPWDEFKISPLSTAIHNIGQQQIDVEGRPRHFVMERFLVWVKTRTLPGKKVLMIAHNASFDRDVLYKSLPEDPGKGGALLGWHWYCTLEAVKRYFPEIYWSRPDGPHKLMNLTRYFFPTFLPKKGGTFHSAVFDCGCLRRIFIQKILPLEMEKYGENWTESSINLLSYVPPSGPLQVKMLTLVNDVKWFRYWKAQKICEFTNKEFLRAGGEWANLACPTNMLTCAHLFMYGRMKALEAIQTEEDSPLMRDAKKLETDKDMWWLACREVEYMLRGLLGMSSDEMILTMFSYITNSNMADLACGLKTEMGTPFFPTLAGQPISYRPFDFDEDLSKLMFERHGMRTSHDIYIAYYCLPDDQSRRNWMYSILAGLSFEQKQRFGFDICENVFAEMSKQWNFNAE